MFNQIAAVLRIFFGTIFTGKNQAGKFFLLTALAGLVVGAGMIWAIWSLSSSAGSYIADMLPWDWAKQSAVFSVLTAAAGFIILYILFRYLFLILLSPFLSYISEKQEHRIKGVKAHAGFSILHSATRSIRINSRNLLRETVISVLLLIAGFIPLVTLFAVPALLMIQAYFTGFGIMDYYLERHYTFKETIREVRSHKWAAITLGALFMVTMMIPVLGQMAGPYLCTVTATRYFCSVQESGLKKNK
jgi:CysZ protein